MSKILLFITLCVGQAWAGLPNTAFLRVQDEYAVDGTSQQILPNNTNRSYLLIVNEGPDTVRVKFGSAHVGSEGIPIPATGNYEPHIPLAEAVYIKTDGLAGTVEIVEGNNR